jgi:hypothetical protein
MRDPLEMDSDPYRTLGLEPGASMAEVKRAYRRLAKAFHPDSAGEAALPRFLAIHEAYERLKGGGPPRPFVTQPAPAAEPWRADPARARAARQRASAGRNRAGAAGTAAGARGATGTSGGGTSGGRGAGAGARPGARSGASSQGPTGSTGPTGGATGGRGAGRSSGRRETRKATLGSTSYDEARDPADVTWSGASWYGPTTGEYWIVNPREYADPRKHGPDYQSRARRPAIEDERETGTAHEADATFDSEAGAAATTAGAATAAFATAGARAPGGDPRRPRASTIGADATSRPWTGATPRWNTSYAARARAAREGRELGADGSPLSSSLFGSSPSEWLGGPADDPIRRLGIALVAWPPLGLAAAAAIGEVTGCAAYAAECSGSDSLLPWLAQAGILGLLLLVPPIARVLAGGAIAVVLALVPATAFLIVVGGSGQPEAGFALAFLLGLAWLAGVGSSAWSARRRRSMLGADGPP